ncbi:uncharacterized protein G2W53_041587 [Senna tora]|uniref:Uncharacterized protein n=1 Tax=Senna tora TaxID=362788 RepID=A0A834W1K5_9FABA|nr:uncharacterized protein G2W53_041587 [Senna tora]
MAIDEIPKGFCTKGILIYSHRAINGNSPQIGRNRDRSRRFTEGPSLRTTTTRATVAR